jgi:hypothetical protein
LAIKRKRFLIEQIVAVLKQAELGFPVEDLLRQVGISEQTLLPLEEAVWWPGNEPGSGVQAVVGESGRLKKLVAELSLDKAVPQEVCQKSFQAGAHERCPRYVTACHGYSERRARVLTRQHRSTQRKASRRDRRLAIPQRMHEIVRTRLRYGYRRVQIMLKRSMPWRQGPEGRREGR